MTNRRGATKGPRSPRSPGSQTASASTESDPVQVRDRGDRGLRGPSRERVGQHAPRLVADRRMIGGRKVESTPSDFEDQQSVTVIKQICLSLAEHLGRMAAREARHDK